MLLSDLKELREITSELSIKSLCSILIGKYQQLYNLQGFINDVADRAELQKILDKERKKNASK